MPGIMSDIAVTLFHRVVTLPKLKLRANLSLFVLLFIKSRIAVEKIKELTLRTLSIPTSNRYLLFIIR